MVSFNQPGFYNDVRILIHEVTHADHRELEDGKDVDDGTSRMDDYRKTNAGTLQSFFLMQVKNGKILSTTKISNIELNKKVEEKVFEM